MKKIVYNGHVLNICLAFAYYCNCVCANKYLCMVTLLNICMIATNFFDVAYGPTQLLDSLSANLNIQWCVLTPWY